MLNEKDSVYKNVISNLSLKEKISYCEQLIDRAQLTLMRNRSMINESIEDQLKQIIEAAQKEILHLKNWESTETKMNKNV